MSHTNQTPNYQLPQFLSTDKPAWMADINQAFLNIDTAMDANADNITTNTTAISGLDTAVNDPGTGLVTRMGTAEGNISNLQGTVGGNSAAIATLQTASAMEGKTYQAVTSTGSKATAAGTINFETFTAPDSDITYANGVFTVNKVIKTLMVCAHMVATPTNTDNQFFIELFRDNTKELDALSAGTFVTLDPVKIFTDVQIGTTFYIRNVKSISLNASGTYPAYMELVIIHG